MNQEAFKEAYGEAAAEMRLCVVENYRQNVASNPDSTFFATVDGRSPDYGWTEVTNSIHLSKEYAAELEEAWAKAKPYQSNPSGIAPTEFKCLVLPDPTEEKSKGGIIIPTELVDKNKFATTEGTLIAASPLAFTYASEAEWDGNKPMPGDRIIYERYAGGSTHVKGKDGVEYILVNDRSIFAKAEF